MGVQRKPNTPAAHYHLTPYFQTPRELGLLIGSILSGFHIYSSDDLGLVIMLKPNSTSATMDPNTLALGERRRGILTPPFPARSSKGSVHTSPSPFTV